jgi:hypothetical protein
MCGGRRGPPDQAKSSEANARSSYVAISDGLDVMFTFEDQFPRNSIVGTQQTALPVGADEKRITCSRWR